MRVGRQVAAGHDVLVQALEVEVGELRQVGGAVALEGEGHPGELVAPAVQATGVQHGAPPSAP